VLCATHHPLSWSSVAIFQTVSEGEFSEVRDWWPADSPANPRTHPEFIASGYPALRRESTTHCKRKGDAATMR
jgi:hypothetical protein